MANTSASQIGLRRVDAGWLYLLAGATLVSSMMLIGPADDLVQLRYRRDRLGALEDDAIAKLQAYETFLEAIDEADPMLVRRLAAAQLNLIPESSKPIGLIGAELDAHVDDWIIETLPSATQVAPPKVKDSWLRRLSASPTRLWAILAGVVLIFIGLLPQAEVAPEVDEEALDHDEGEDGAEGQEGGIGKFDGADFALPRPGRCPIVTETGELLDEDDIDAEADEPLVQVVTISASSAP